MLVMADPTDIPVVDELSLLLQTPDAAGGGDALGHPGGAEARPGHDQRVLEQASESFKIQILREDENGEEVLSIDKIQADQSPDHPPRGLHDLRRPEPARLGHPHRDPRHARS